MQGKALCRTVLLAGCLTVFGTAWADVRVGRLEDRVVRVRMDRQGTWSESLLNRYGLIRTKDVRQTTDAVPEDFVRPDVRQTEKGFELRFPLAADERIYGLGDASRKNLNRRGDSYEIWIKDYVGYIPIPMVISSRGWGLLVNSTRRHFFDIGKTDPDALVVSAEEGEVDFYLFRGRDYRELLDVYTQLTGRPKLLPIFAYGFAYVANQWVDSYELARDAYEFRKLDIPCDTFGLEPGWMEAFYDSTTKKEWNKRLEFPYWAKPNEHHLTWVGALERMGFKLSLWLCMKYDLFVYEEACAEGKAIATSAKAKTVKANAVNEAFKDEHISGSFSSADRSAPELKQLKAGLGHARRQMVERVDGLTGEKESGEEPWFDHLRKFVDQGARCFKLDASWQVLEFPDRLWAGKYTDAVAHNVYSSVYDKQMCEGYENYTDRRALVYSAGGYVGVQRYVATWAGDTGGGQGALASVLNLAVSGHPNQSCDLEVADLPSLHFGIFSPWCQQNNWDYFQQPWYRTKEEMSVIRDYVNLRYRLVPYVYAAAAEAARTGWPIARPLAIAYPEIADYANECGTYLLGDNLLVSAFSDTVKIPPGTWHEWRTGETVVGPAELPVKVTRDWGGALYVKAGSVIPTWPVRQSLDKGWNEEVVFEVWPTDKGRFTLYEDDGDSLAFGTGAYALTDVTMTPDGKGRVTFAVGKRRGAYAGMPTARRMKVRLHDGGKVVERDLGDVGAEGLTTQLP